MSEVGKGWEGTCHGSCLSPTVLRSRPWGLGDRWAGDEGAGLPACCHSPGCIHCVLVLGDTGSRGAGRGAAGEGPLRLPRVLEQTQRNSRCLHARRLVQNRYQEGFPAASGRGQRGERGWAAALVWPQGFPSCWEGIWRWGVTAWHVSKCQARGIIHPPRNGGCLGV